MPTALEGMRILELSVGMAGSMAGMFLTENGAEVIKIEPPGGDPTRGSSGFTVRNRGKRSVVLDLKNASDVEKFKELVETTDGVIEDFAPGVADRLGVGYDDLCRVNSGIVYSSITAFGEEGPYRDLPGYEPIVAAKTGRMISQEGFREGPIYTPTPISSYGSACIAVQGLLAALYARKVTGKGQRVDVRHLSALTAYDMGGFLHAMHANEEKDGPAYGVIPLAFMTAECSDGRYIQMCSRQPHLFRNWMRVLGLEHLYDDPSFHNMPDQFPSTRDLEAVLEMVEQRMKDKTCDEWMEIFTSQDVGGDPFLGAQEYLNHEQAIANGRRQIVVEPGIGETVQIGPLGNFSETPSAIGMPSPALGQHTEEVLSSIQMAPRKVTVSTGTSVRRPLDGVTVLECAYFYAAPFSMTLLAELGARIIKVEPNEGDPMRRNWASTYSKSAAGKESIILNLKTEEGREIVHKIAAKADLFLHNFRPTGVVEKLQIDYKTLSAINPRLIYIYGSCYGTYGPWKHRPGFHSSPNAIAGSGIIESGLGNPPKDRVFPDPAGALGVATSALMGLHARELTGKGQYVETTMLSSLAYAVSSWSLQYGNKPADPIPDQGQHGYNALHWLYECGDGWLFVMCPKEEHWTKLADATGLSGDRRFLTVGAREENDEALRSALSDAFKRRPASQWEDMLLQVGVPAVRADGTPHHEFMLNDPQVRLIDLAREDELPEHGKFWRSAPVYHFSEYETRFETPRPLGFATEDVLREFGYSDRQIDELNRKGVTTAVGHGLPAV